MNKQKILSLLLFFGGFAWIILGTLITRNIYGTFDTVPLDVRLFIVVFPWLVLSSGGVIFYPKRGDS